MKTNEVASKPRRFAAQLPHNPRKVIGTFWVGDYFGGSVRIPSIISSPDIKMQTL